jgi:hypothetical protein
MMNCFKLSPESGSGAVQVGLGPGSSADRLAAWALNGPLTAALGVWILVLLALWVPHYLTWPIWIDIDQFAIMSMGWDRGTQLPYRDLFTYNLPGQIYLFWLVGKLAGWGNTAALYALDATLVILLGLAMARWSRALFGRMLPGIVGYLAFLGFYQGLAYHMVLQRDWHSGFFAVLGLMAMQVWSSRLGWLASALAMAAALLIRPQAILYLPALMVALDARVRTPGESPWKTVRATAQWGLAVATILAIGFAPLATAGILGDFLHAFGETIGDGAYTSSPREASRLQKLLFLQGMYPIWSIPVVLGLLTRRLDLTQRRLAWPWIVAIGFVCFYIPLTPIFHYYLEIPIILVWSFNLALLVQALFEVRGLSPVLRLAAIGLVVLIGKPWKPEFSQLSAVWLAMSNTATIPPGYCPRPENGVAAFYDWFDYKKTLNYLCRRTGPDTRVANALLNLPAIVYPTARTSTFPAESLQLLVKFNRLEDWKRYAAALGRAPADSVVVWNPSEETVVSEALPDFRLIAQLIRRNYQPEAKFGSIEVWRHKAGCMAVSRRKPEQIRFLHTSRARSTRQPFYRRALRPGRGPPSSASLSTLKAASPSTSVPSSV